MDYVKTLYLGCEDNGDKAIPGVHETKYVNKRNTRGHMEISNYLAYPFVHSQRLFEMNILTEPFKFCLLVERRLKCFKFKESNVWTQMDSILYFLNSYHPPDCGLIVSIYYVDRYSCYDQASLTSLWPFKEDMQWVGDGNYVTYHWYEPNINMKNIHRKDYIHTEIAKIVKDLEHHCIHPIKVIDYSMGEDKMFKLLKHCNIIYHMQEDHIIVQE